MKLNSEDFYTSLIKWEKAFLEQKIADRCSNNTILIYKGVFNKFIEFSLEHNDTYTMEMINNIYINAYKLYLDELKLSDTTKNTHITIIKSFLAFITSLNDDLFDYTKVISTIKKIKSENVTDGLKEEQYLNKNERERLILYINREFSKKENNFFAIRGYLIINILLYCAPRASELINLKLSDIKVDEESVNYYVLKFKGKGNKLYKDWITKDKIEYSLEDFINYFSNFDNSDLYIASRKDGTQMTRQELYLTVNRIIKAAGIKKRGVHLFRHTLGKWLIVEKNLNIVQVQRKLNHSNITTTAKFYSNVIEKDKKGVADVM